MRVRRLAWILLLAAPADAQPALPAPGAPGSAAAHVEALQQAHEDAAEQTLARFDRRVAEAPGDAIAALERCRFIEGAFYDPLEGNSTRQEGYDACRAELEERFGDHPDVGVALIEDLYEEDAVVAGEEFLAAPPEAAEPRHLAAVHAHLAEQDYDEVSSGEHAEQAMALDPSRELRAIAARGRIASGDRDGARELLLAGLMETEETWQLRAKAALLTELDAFDEALAAFREADRRDGQPEAHEDLPRALAGTGDVEGARAAWQALEDGWVSDEARRARFEFELAHGDAASAAAAYEWLRNDDWSNDPFGRDRLTLLLAHPSAPWSWSHAWGFVGLGFLLFGVALVPSLWILPVAFAGLGRRAALAPPADERSFTLRQAWAVSALYLIAETIGVFLYFEIIAEPDDTSPAGRALLARHALLTFSLSLAAVLLIVRGRVRSLLAPGTWGWQRMLAAAAGATLVLQLVFALAVWALSAESADPATTELVRAVSASYGLPVSLFLVALLVPVLEEIVFRGVLLSAFARHLSPRWANWVQAGLFGLAHAHPVVTPYSFAIGLVTGWMTRRTGSLRPAVLLHVVNNAVAVVSIAAF